MFLAAADLMLSLMIFILLFPFFVTLAFLVHIPSSGTVNVLISSRPTNQGSLADVFSELLVFEPPSESEDTKEKTDKLNARNWHVRVYEISYVQSRYAENIKDAIAQSSKAGAIITQTRGNLSDARTIEILSEMLQRRKETRDIKTIAQAEGFFASHSVWRLTVAPEIQYSFFLRTYAGVLRRINFLDEELLRVLALRSRSITQDDVIHSYSSRSVFPRLFESKREQIIFCDGKYSEIEDTSDLEIGNQFDDCTEGVANNSVGFRNIEAMALYSSSLNLPVPLSPLALSSLTATILVYYLLLSRMAFKYLRAAFLGLFSDGEHFLTKHLFVITTCFAIVILLPLFAIVRIWS